VTGGLAGHNGLVGARGMDVIVRGWAGTRRQE